MSDECLSQGHKLRGIGGSGASCERCGREFGGARDAGGGLTEERLRQVWNLRLMLLDTMQEVELTAREAEKVLPPGAVPGLIRTGRDWVESALEIVDATLRAAEGKERSDP